LMLPCIPASKGLLLLYTPGRAPWHHCLAELACALGAIYCCCVYLAFC
jgi:hypothetical protein